MARRRTRAKTRKRRRSGGSGIAGWRLNGTRVYHVKGKRRTRKKTYKSKLTARRALKRKLGG